MFEKNGNELTMQFVIHKTLTKILTIFGTRPGAIKLAPVILKARRDNSFDVRICVTGQHDEMLKQVLDFFGITLDHDLEIMQPNQSLYDVTADILKALQNFIASEDPSLVLVQGDTTTAFAGALCAFYQKVPVAHVEAGLRSYSKHSPFLKEIKRV